MVCVDAAWIQASKGGVPVTAMFKTGSGTYIRAGSIVAESNCWSMLKGGFPANASGPAELYFEVLVTNYHMNRATKVFAYLFKSYFFCQNIHCVRLVIECSKAWLNYRNEEQTHSFRSLLQAYAQSSITALTIVFNISEQGHIC